jgi:hypothetical protein
MSAPPRDLIDRLLSDEQRRLLVKRLELDARGQAIRDRIDDLARERAAIEAVIKTGEKHG